MAEGFFNNLKAKIAQNIDDNDKTLKDQLSLVEKQVADPNYQPSEPEQANANKYFDNLTGAVAGAISPGNKIAKIVAPEVKAITNVVPLVQEAGGTASRVRDSMNLANAAYENALSANPIINSATAEATQHPLSRSVDFAQRIAKQLLDRKSGK